MNGHPSHLPPFALYNYQATTPSAQLNARQLNQTSYIQHKFIEPNLSTWPSFALSKLAKEGHGAIIVHDVQIWGYHEFGFVVSRCTYNDDDAAWTRFLSNTQREGRSKMTRYNCAELLTPLLESTIVEDWEKLDRASTKQVRAVLRSGLEG